MTLLHLDHDEDDDDSEEQLKLLHQVLERLQADLLACDAQWTLFVAAANSYRYESLLLNFPKEFLNSSQELNVDLICQTIAEVPRLELVLQELMFGNWKCLPPLVVKLLHTILVKHGDRVSLSTLRPCEFSELYDHLKMPVPQNSPTQIYEVMASAKCPCAKAHADLRVNQEYPVRLGFYGGKLDNLYAIIMAGNMPNETEPVMLTTDIDEALAMSSPQAGWGASKCGSILRFVAVVEFINMPSCVTVVEGNRQVLIRISSCMQISYLLFYGQSYDAYEASMEQPCKRLYKWVDNNRYALSMGVYLMGLSFMSQTGRGFFRKFAHTGFEYFKKGLLKI